MITVLKDKYPVARKPHKCTCCGHIIQPGEKYHRQTLVYDDTPYDWVMDMDCDVVFDYIVDRLRFNGFDGEDGLGEDEFNEEIWEILIEDLNMEYNYALSLNYHERVVIVREHLEELKEQLKQYKHDRYEYQKKLRYFNDMRYREQRGELNTDEITQYKKEYAEWILARSNITQVK